MAGVLNACSAARYLAGRAYSSCATAQRRPPYLQVRQTPKPPCVARDLNRAGGAQASGRHSPTENSQFEASTAEQVPASAPSGIPLDGRTLRPAFLARNNNLR